MAEAMSCQTGNIPSRVYSSFPFLVFRQTSSAIFPRAAIKTSRASSSESFFVSFAAFKIPSTISARRCENRSQSSSEKPFRRNENRSCSTWKPSSRMPAARLARKSAPAAFWMS